MVECERRMGTSYIVPVKCCQLHPHLDMNPFLFAALLYYWLVPIAPMGLDGWRWVVLIYVKDIGADGYVPYDNEPLQPREMKRG